MSAADIVRFAFITGWRPPPKCCRSNGGTSIGTGAAFVWTRTPTKNDEGRVFPFTADLGKVLTEQLAIPEQLKAADTICRFVFHRSGERMGYFRTARKNACKAAGCPGALVHDMRGSSVRTFERASVPRSVVMSTGGHKTESIHRRYAIVDEAMQREAAARLDAFTSVPQSANQTGTVKTFKPKVASATKRPRERSA